MLTIKIRPPRYWDKTGYMVRRQIPVVGTDKIIEDIRKYTPRGLYNLLTDSDGYQIFYEHSAKLEILVNTALQRKAEAEKQ